MATIGVDDLCFNKNATSFLLTIGHSPRGDLNLLAIGNIRTNATTPVTHFYFHEVEGRCWVAPEAISKAIADAAIANRSISVNPDDLMSRDPHSCTRRMLSHMGYTEETVGHNKLREWIWDMAYFDFMAYVMGVDALGFGMVIRFLVEINVDRNYYDSLLSPLALLSLKDNNSSNEMEMKEENDLDSDSTEEEDYNDSADEMEMEGECDLNSDGTEKKKT